MVMSPAALAIVSFIIVAAQHIQYGEAHPQCVDFLPPFQVNGGLQFCSNYSDFGCCTEKQDAEIQIRYNKIITSSLNDAAFNIDDCKSYLKDILCQECSPYAVHIFDAETDLVKNAFPGLCQDYCDEFYRTCKNLVSYITDDNNVIASLGQSQQFCDTIAIKDETYCFPQWMNIPILSDGILPKTTDEEGCLCLELFADKLRNPLSFRYPPDDSGRIFISEQLGQVHIFYKNKTRVEEPFMDLSHLVLSSSNPGDERGFFNLAFDPDFISNNRVYVYFSILHNTTGEHVTRLSEFKISQNDKNKIDPESERVIIEIPQPYGNHNGGELLFGLDDYLYVFLGDGGAGGDPHGNGQNKSTYLGSVLRLDVNTDDPSIPYNIPPDNPFVGENDSKPEIYAYGIRNTWRCDVDEGDPDTGLNQGRIICGDVGQSTYEEVNIIEKGGNYGWNAKEGFECFDPTLCNTVGPVIDPIHAYNHSVGQSVTGGAVYRGCLNPNLQGLYLFGDFNNGKLFRLKENGDHWENKEVLMCGSDICFNGLTNQYERNILSFGEDDDGEIYILSTSFASSTSDVGKVHKLVDPRRRGDPTKCRTYKDPEDPKDDKDPSDPCLPNPCENNGICSSSDDTYYCWCPPYFRGQHCEIHLCLPNPCENNGICSSSDNSYYCWCPPYFRGQHCEIHPCLPDPCENNGICSYAEDPYKFGYYCWCPPHFGGKHCQIRDPCGSHPVGTTPCPPYSTTIFCFRSVGNDRGRYCFDKNWQVQEVPNTDFASDVPQK